MGVIMILRHTNMLLGLVFYCIALDGLCLLLSRPILWYYGSCNLLRNSNSSQDELVSLGQQSV